MTKETLAIVVGALRELGDASATQIGEFLGCLAHITARRFLEHLADTNVAERTLKYGAGRTARDPLRAAPVGTSR